MKDAIHHLKHTQKKVIQSARKEEEKPVTRIIDQANGNFEKNSKKDSSA